MSSDCATCDCPDKNNCPKKAKSFGVEIVETNNNKMSWEFEMEIVGGENDCKCGPGCKCNGCTCGH